MSACVCGDRALFLHIPKTGGSWVESTLKAHGLGDEKVATIDGVTWRHAPLPMLRQSFDFTFTFVRHPLSWYESWWKFQAGQWQIFEPGVWHPQRTLERCQSDDFSEFIRLMIRHEPGYVSRMYEWFIGPPGHDYVQFVGRQETLAGDLVEVLTRLGCEFDVEMVRQAPRANESPKQMGEPVWDPGLRARVLELEAPAVARFYRGWAEPQGLVQPRRRLGLMGRMATRLGRGHGRSNGSLWKGRSGERESLRSTG